MNSYVPIAPIPWQITGNHWVAAPCIHPVDGSIYALGVLHRGLRAAVEFAGGSDFASGRGMPLARPHLEVDGVAVPLAEASLAWERVFSWIPTFTAAVGQLLVRATVFAPYGRDADMAGLVYTIGIENRGQMEARISVGLEGYFGCRQVRIREPRAAPVLLSVRRSSSGAVILAGDSISDAVSLAILCDGEHLAEIREGNQREYALRRPLRVAAGSQVECAFYFGFAPDPDGAEAMARAMRRRGWRHLLAATRDAIRGLEQSTGHEAIDRLLNRNLLLAYFYGVGRAIDDARFYLVRTRAPWHSQGVTIGEWEALSWILPAVLLADAPLARELLLRACELYGYAPGAGVRYLDGLLFEPGFCLEGAAAYALAVDRYIRETGDDRLLDDPIVADTLYLAYDDISGRRNERVPVYATEVTPLGVPPAFSYTLHANAVVAQALEVFRSTLDEETARDVEDPELVRAALRRHFTKEQDGKQLFLSAVNLSGEAVAADDPVASLYWLPMYDFVERSDSAYRRTVRALDGPHASLARQCARLVGPESREIIQWLRRAPLHMGFAAAAVDPEGRAVGDATDAALAGLLTRSLWYASHSLGVLP
jgi:hypothetical protein